MGTEICDLNFNVHFFSVTSAIEIIALDQFLCIIHELNKGLIYNLIQYNCLHTIKNENKIISVMLVMFTDSAVDDTKYRWPI